MNSVYLMVVHFAWSQTWPNIADVKLLHVFFPAINSALTVVLLLDRIISTLSPCSLRPQADQDWLCVKYWTLLIDDYTLSWSRGRCKTTCSWCWVVMCGPNRWCGLAIRTRMIRVYTCDIHSIHSLGLCLEQEVTGVNSCSTTSVKLPAVCHQ